MRVIVNDSSALIDLRKGGLLEVFVDLRYEFVISDSILADELLSFSRDEIALLKRKMVVATLDGDEIVNVGLLQRSSPVLSFHDCSALVIAQREKGCILLTGDRRLRNKAEAAAIECHGVLWIIEEIVTAKLTTPRKLIKALETWRDDTTVHLPRSDIDNAIARLKR
jgi:predicted nucleic acid-binding protein